MRVSFSEFILSLGTAALASMGKLDDNELKGGSRDLEVARYNIDVLLMLREKSVGNLDHDEQALLESVLYDLQMVYLEESKVQ